MGLLGSCFTRQQLHKQMINQSKINALRIHYKNVRKMVYKMELPKIKYEDLKLYRAQADQEAKKLSKERNYKDINQVQFYRDTFSTHVRIVEDAFRQKKKWKQLVPEIKELYKKDHYVPDTIKQLTTTQLYFTRLVSERLTSPDDLPNFFASKRAKIASAPKFQSFFNKPAETEKQYKKKPYFNKEDLKKLKEQNKALELKIKQDTKAVSLQKQQYQKQRLKSQADLKKLGRQNENIMFTNQNLKRQMSYIGPEYEMSVDEEIYAPYFIQYKQNDLYKINIRNQIENEYRDNTTRQSRENKNHKKRDFDVFSRMIKEDDDQTETYDIFDPASQKCQITDCLCLGIENPKTVQQNKLCFFRYSGILVRNIQVEIGFKKSMVDGKGCHQIFILYFKNRTENDKKLEVFYDYEKEYYDIKFTKKLHQIAAFQQTRQIIELQLKDQPDNLNSIIQMRVQLGARTYKLWLPIMFIQFRKNNSLIHNFQQQRIIQPAKGFENPQQTKNVLQQLSIKNNQGEVWGRSRIHQGLIKLAWKSDNKLSIKTSRKWMDMIAFVLLDYH